MMTVLRRNPLKQSEEASLEAEDGSTNDHDVDRKRSRRSQSRPLFCLILLGLLLAAIFVILLLMSSDSDKSEKEQEQAISSSIQQQQSPGSSSMENRQSRRRDLFAQIDENCKLPPPPPRRDSWTTKPLLLPGYPSFYSEAKGPGDMIQPMIRHLTGLPQGARNFHASSKGSLKRCHMTNPSVETVTCSQVHPIVSIAPEKHTKLFDPNVLLAIQNFAMAFPMGHSIKANRYNNVQGQTSIDDWRKARGMYLEEAFDKWKSVITTWKASYDYYNVSMYLPYEHLMDPVKGPLLIQRLAKKLESVGFAVVNFGDDTNNNTLLQCLWRRSVQDAAKFEKEYIQYIPAYTAKQRDYMLEQMQQLIKETMAASEDDAELVKILKEYHAEIRDSIPIEEEEES